MRKTFSKYGIYCPESAKMFSLFLPLLLSFSVPAAAVLHCHVCNSSDTNSECFKSPGDVATLPCNKQKAYKFFNWLLEFVHVPNWNWTVSGNFSCVYALQSFDVYNADDHNWRVVTLAVRSCVDGAVDACSVYRHIALNLPHMNLTECRQCYKHYCNGYPSFFGVPQFSVIVISVILYIILK